MCTVRKYRMVRIFGGRTFQLLHTIRVILKEVSSRLSLSDMWGYLQGFRTSWCSNRECSCPSSSKTRSQTRNISCQRPTSSWSGTGKPETNSSIDYETEATLNGSSFSEVWFDSRWNYLSERKDKSKEMSHKLFVRGWGASWNGWRSWIPPLGACGWRASFKLSR